MTASVKKAIEKIYNNEIFNDELYFCGGTALAYYLISIFIIGEGKTKKVDLGKGMSTRQLNMMLKELYNDRPLS